MTLSDVASVALAFSGRVEVSTESVAVSYFALRIGNSSSVPVQITSLMRDASSPPGILGNPMYAQGFRTIPEESK